MGKDNKALCVLASNVFLLPPRSGDLWLRRRLECSHPSTKLLAILPNKTEPAPWGRSFHQSIPAPLTSPVA